MTQDVAHDTNATFSMFSSKVLSELAMMEPWSFKALVDQVKFMRGQGSPAAVAASQHASIGVSQSQPSPVVMLNR